MVAIVQAASYSTKTVLFIPEYGMYAPIEL